MTISGICRCWVLRRLFDMYLFDSMSICWYDSFRASIGILSMNALGIVQIILNINILYT